MSLGCQFGIPRFLLLAAAAILIGPAAVQAAASPYPGSTVIPEISFRWETHRQSAPGSDNWPLTWSADDHQYTTFGDGGGFAGSRVRGRVSLGLARVEGTAASYRGHNIWGGADAETSAKFMGKSYGILAIGPELYMWRCGAGSGAAAFDFQQLHSSSDGGISWRAASWLFPKSLTFYCPTFLQFGKGYAGARDAYVYMYAAERNDATWRAQVPGAIILMRAPRDRLMERAAYTFFAGMDAGGEPRWSVDAADRKAVFADPNGVRLASAAYNPSLGRYLLTTEHAPKGSGNIGIFDAAEPWGPWTTVLYEDGWGSGHVPPTTFFVNFAPKWWGNGGKDFVLAFSGDGTLDSWNTVEGSFSKGGPAVGGQQKPAVAKKASPPSASSQDGLPAADRSRSRSREAAAQPQSRSSDARLVARVDGNQPSTGAAPSRRQVYLSGSGLGSALPSGPMPAKGEATASPAANGAASTSPGPNTGEITVTAKNAPTTASGLTTARPGKHRERAASKAKSDAAAAAPLDPATASTATVSPLGDAAPVTTASPPPPASAGVLPPLPDARAADRTPMRPNLPSAAASIRTSLSVSPQPSLPIAPEIASVSSELPPEPRLAGTMVHGPDTAAIVVPAGASESVTVRPGDTVGPWSVESVKQHALMLRAGDRVLDLHLPEGRKTKSSAELPPGT